MNGLASFRRRAITGSSSDSGSEEEELWEVSSRRLSCVSLRNGSIFSDGICLLVEWKLEKHSSKQ